jgi:hypothetical protein
LQQENRAEGARARGTGGPESGFAFKARPYESYFPEHRMPPWFFRSSRPLISCQYSSRTSSSISIVPGYGPSGPTGTRARSKGLSPRPKGKPHEPPRIGAFQRLSEPVTAQRAAEQPAKPLDMGNQHDRQEASNVEAPAQQPSCRLKLRTRGAIHFAFHERPFGHAAWTARRPPLHRSVARIASATFVFSYR